MSLTKKIVLAMALTASSVFGGEPKPVSYDNSYMDSKIEQYFEKRPGTKFYKDGSFFIVKGNRDVQKFRELEERLWTPETVSEFMQENQKYVSDRLDGHEGPSYMESPLEFYLSGTGDCEDFANFAYHMLSKSGYEPSILAFAYMDSGHAVCSIEQAGVHSYIDNVGYHKFETLEQLSNNINKFLKIKSWLVGTEIVPNYSEKTGMGVIKVFVNPYAPKEMLEEESEFQKWIDELFVKDNEKK